MSASRSSRSAPEIAEETTPKPTSAVHTTSSAEQAPASPRRGADRTAALLEYFANPSRIGCANGRAYVEFSSTAALALSEPLHHFASESIEIGHSDTSRSMHHGWIHARITVGHHVAEPYSAA